MGVYLLQGVGRATFEGTFKACFVDFFSYAREAAFANVVLLYGISGAIAYVLTVEMKCSRPSTYCIEYRDRSLHHIGILSWGVILASLVGIAGFARASCLQNTAIDPAVSRHQNGSVPAHDHQKTRWQSYDSVGVGNDPRTID